MASPVTRRILIECGAAETRAAHVVDHVVTHLWFGPARGDEALPRPPARGDLFAGRVAAVSAPLKAAFVDIGAARPGFLAIRKGEKPPVEGERVIVIVHRPPIGEKGAVLSRDWKGALSGVAVLEEQAKTIGVGALGERASAPVAAFIACRPEEDEGAVAAVVNGEIARRALEEWGGAGAIEVSATAFREAAVDDAIEEALSASVPIVGGARLFIDATAAGVMFDVDTGTASEGATAKLNDAVNAAAADRILLELTRRSIGGRVAADFLPPLTSASRAHLSERLRSGLRSIRGARFGKLAPDGFADFTLPRRTFTLLERATEPAGADWPVQGRRFTLDWSAKAAIRALESALAARPASSPRLIVPEETENYLQAGRPQWKDRLAARYGARFQIQSSPSIGTRRHELVE